jgi:hypothetical protein
MTSNPERAQRGADLSGVSLVSFNIWPGADGVGVPNTAINDDFAHRFQANELDCMKVLAQFRRADELDAEAAYYGHRAMQEEQARGPGYFTGLFRALATDRATMAQRLRNVNEETR